MENSQIFKGNVIYVKVVNGTVIVEYTLLENMNAGNYNITVIFTVSGYDMLIDTKHLFLILYKE